MHFFGMKVQKRMDAGLRDVVGASNRLWSSVTFSLAAIESWL
jgi:hypothetical protein